jgi:hypothetical protein
MALGLHRNHLLLGTRQQFPFYQRQTEIGDIAEIIGRLIVITSTDCF